MRTNELLCALDDLTAAAKAISECGEKLARAVTAIRDVLSDDAEAEQPIAPDEETTGTTASEAGSTPIYTFTDVRKAFSAKSHAGYTEQVKALITRYGAAKLSDVKEEDYPAIMTDLEGIS